MALVKFGNGLVQMSGSIAGTVFARNKYGNYARARTKPVNTNSTSQQAIRNAISSVVGQWLSTLTQTMRDNWITYAGSVAAKNRLGESINLSGFNHFVRSNSFRVYAGLDVVTAGPSVFALPDKDGLFAITLDTGAQKISVAFDDTADWCSEDGAVMAIYASGPQSRSRKFFGGPYRLIGTIVGDSASPPTSPVQFDPPSEFAGNHKVYAQARISRADGRLSGIFRTDSEAPMNYCLSGTMTPDFKGTYDVTAYYNDKLYLTLNGGTQVIWWDGIDSWICSTALGILDAGYWKRTNVAVAGTYTHQGTATGDPVLAEGSCA